MIQKKWASLDLMRLCNQKRWILVISVRFGDYGLLKQLTIDAE